MQHSRETWGGLSAYWRLTEASPFSGAVAPVPLQPNDASTIDPSITLQTKRGCRVTQTDEYDRLTIAGGGAPRYSRRLSDKIVIAFHDACDQGDLEVAEKLLHVLETVLTRLPPEGNRLRDTEPLIAAHERLWNLGHQNARDHRNPWA
jgi:hypothetical protein